MFPPKNLARKVLMSSPGWECVITLVFLLCGIWVWNENFEWHKITSPVFFVLFFAQHSSSISVHDGRMYQVDTGFFSDISLMYVAWWKSHQGVLCIWAGWPKGNLN